MTPQTFPPRTRRAFGLPPVPPLTALAAIAAGGVLALTPVALGETRGAFLLAAALGAALAATLLVARRAFFQMVERVEAERRASVRRVIEGQEEERRRIARELHDGLGQGLTAALLMLDRLPRESLDEAAALGDVREAVRESLEEVRGLVRRLRPEALDDLGLPSALSALGARLARQSGMAITRSLDRELPPLTDEAELTLYRIAQEGLTNALRHAEASRVNLTLGQAGGGVTLEVLDDGRGLDGAEPGAGLRGMDERARFVGGRLDVATRADGGTRVRLTVPLRAEARA